MKNEYHRKSIQESMDIVAKVFNEQSILQQMYSPQGYSMNNEYYSKSIQESMDMAANVLNGQEYYSECIHRECIQWTTNITAKLFKNQWISK